MTVDKLDSQYQALINAENMDTAYAIGGLATQAMLYEASCFPAPGLVSPVSNGAHKDMNYYTFIDSACALGKFFVFFAAAGLSGRPDKQVFSQIRAMGLVAEREMFQKTNGVNTHKGMLFVLGICCAAVGKTLYTQGNFEAIAETVRSMTAGLVAAELTREGLSGKDDLTHGEKIYLRHNLPGVRAEVEAGLPTVFFHALPCYEASADLPANDRLVQTLLTIMGHCEDTNIVHRHSPETLREVQTKAAAIMEAGGMRSAAGRAMVESLAAEFAAGNISPGGSADLLGITVFLSLVRERFNFTKGNYGE
ncbi:triphosphoribosyl-dephospho-CoA synthase CitG [Deltaproteobacteria bacterium OttesenSCG-928-M10]|nr:triphosphoribosyl-dephospho-CoA synthase CitG [Deltaproteobacteria bacterium OttesenSCG-928-M10]